ncbi:hypothetical protein [Tannerella sp.]|uniref:hypothetical protein n=1 Tax=Tannerella sp. TaxID=2382127 RepID=UPI003FA26C27
MGALANLSDGVALFRRNGQNIKVNSAKTTRVDEYENPNEWWGHSSITNEKGNSLLSVGPDSLVGESTSLSKLGRILSKVQIRVRKYIWANKVLGL